MSLPIVRTVRFFSETYGTETIAAKHFGIPGIRNIVQAIVTGNGGPVTITDTRTTKSTTVADGVSKTFPAENFAVDFTLNGDAFVECYIKE